MTEPTTPRGTPPNDKQLAKDLGPRLALWNAIAAMVKDFDANWRWVHSENQNTWTFRSYLPGERFFCAITAIAGGLEVSLNMKAEEWEAIDGANAAERETLAALREKALATGDEPAWIHVPMKSEADLPVLAKVLFARGRRVQPPREKKKRFKGKR
jgi:hypothetical protein